ncbi:MAG: alpha/beta hydrolase [Saprospiraceae bacterium]|nr:alpha/beta hydrolase [Saprospiraceae bacterium]
MMVLNVPPVSLKPKLRIFRFKNIAAYVLLFILIGCLNEPTTTIESFDGVSVSFDNEGKGAPAIILIHGWSNTRAIWDAQVSSFSEKYQVIAVDLPGFGRSGTNRSDWSIASYGDDISTIVKQLNLNKVVLVGFSLGGSVAIEAAHKIPDRVIGILLVDCLQQIETKISPPMAHYLDSMMMDLVTNPTKEKLVGGGFFKKNVDSTYLRVTSFLDVTSHVGWRESLAGLMKWQNEQCTHSIQALTAPIIAINSDIQPTNVEAFRKYAPTYKAKIVEDVGHLIMWDNPEKFDQLVEESIQEFMSK